jgi:hypothetical protein
MTTLLAPDTGRVIAPVCRQKENTLSEQVKALLGDRLKDHDKAALSNMRRNFANSAHGHGHMVTAPCLLLGRLSLRT